MNQRKNDILEQARQLFNRTGTYSVSTRDISNALGISQGNLTYHFPHKSAIVERLYTQMNQELEAIRQETIPHPISLTNLFIWTRKQQCIQKKYQFIWLDMARLRKDHSEIDGHFSALIEGQRQQFPFLIAALADRGTIRAGLSPATIALLFEQILILGNFWLQAHAVMGDLHPSEISYLQIALGPLLPYLTQAGESEWSALSAVTWSQE